MTAPKRRVSADGVVTRREDPQVVAVSLPGSYAPTVIDLREWPCDVRLRVQLADAIEALTDKWNLEERPVGAAKPGPDKVFREVVWRPRCSGAKTVDPGSVERLPAALGGQWN